MREVEVLHDQLLALFNADTSLQPADVVVLTPDIEPAAPFIDAVLRCTLAHRRAVFDCRPQRGQSAAGAGVHVAAGVAGIALPAGFCARLCLTLAIRARFGYRRSRSAAHPALGGGHPYPLGARCRAQGRNSDLPPTAQNSWREGLARMLLTRFAAGGTG